jgi:DNA-binding transcriptional MerR regulator
VSLLTQPEIRRLERQYPQGLSSAVIVQTFRAKRLRFSEPTLRKYVQLGLLPISRRVGTRGRHRGSSGLYPVVVVRLINEIKRALDKGGTLEEIRRGAVGLGGEVVGLQRACSRVFGRFDEALAHAAEAKRRRELRRRLLRAQRAIERDIRVLDKFAVRIGQLRNGRSETYG